MLEGGEGNALVGGWAQGGGDDGVWGVDGGVELFAHVAEAAGGDGVVEGQAFVGVGFVELGVDGKLKLGFERVVVGARFSELEQLRARSIQGDRQREAIAKDEYARAAFAVCGLCAEGAVDRLQCQWMRQCFDETGDAYGFGQGVEELSGLRDGVRRIGYALRRVTRVTVNGTGGARVRSLICGCVAGESQQGAREYGARPAAAVHLSPRRIRQHGDFLA